VGTGAAALMAVRVLLDHGVQGGFPTASATCRQTDLPRAGWKERNIILLAFLVARQGLLTVRRAFPGVRIVTAAIDAMLTERAFPISAYHLAGTLGGDADYASRLEPSALETSIIDGDDGKKSQEARLDALRFSRELQDSPRLQPKERRAWVIEPGMGHIGDRYYLK
jgi:uridine kinase